MRVKHKCPATITSLEFGSPTWNESEINIVREEITDSMQIKGDLRFCQKTPRGGGPLPFTTHDEIQLASAEIGGYLDCHCGFFWPKQPEQLEQYKTAFLRTR